MTIQQAGDLEQRGRTAQGVVTDYQIERYHDSEGRSSTTEENTIEFSTPEDARYTFAEGGDLGVGTSVTVWYDPLRPSEVATHRDPGTYRWGCFT